MIWLDYFLQLLCNALAWTMAAVAALLVLFTAMRAYAALTSWRWRRSQSRGIQRRFGARG